jgi:polycystin 1L2
MTEVNGFRGFVGYAIRELSHSEMKLYCSNGSINTRLLKLPLIEKRVNFSSDFMLRSYTSGCYYYDVNTGKWNSDGMDIYDDTNLKQTHCMTTHLTAFAGGLVLVPSTINFQYIFENISPTKNPFIYSSVIIITFVYILFALWARFMDKRDSKKMEIVSLKDNNPNDAYFYELIVFTGNRSESGTKSKV